MKYSFFMEEMYNGIRLNGFHQKVSKDWSYPHHRHMIFEVIYCMTGEIKQWANGREYRLQAGDAILIKRGIYHQSAAVQDSEIFVLHFDIEEEHLQAVFQLMDDPLIIGNDNNIYKKAIDRWMFEFLQEFGDLTDDVRNASPKQDLFKRMSSAVHRLRIQSRFLELVGKIAQYVLHAADDFTVEHVQPSCIKLAHEAAYLMEVNVEKGIKIVQLAEQLNVNRSYLTHCFFQSAAGISPLKFRAGSALLRSDQRVIHRG